MGDRSVLVIGAGGFIGRHVHAQLARAGWQPIAGVRDPARWQARAPGTGLAGAGTPGAGPTAARRVDLADAASIAAALEGVVAVANCAAGGADVLAGGARRVFEAAAASPLRPHVVHLSTQSVYGAASGVVDESAPLRADLGAYGAAKIEAERAGEMHAARTILRPGIVFAPDSPQWSTRIARLLRAGRLGDLGPAGEGTCNLVHAADVALAVERSLATAAGAPRCYNLAMPDAPTWNGFFAAYARALGVPVARPSGLRLALEAKLLAIPLKVAEKLGDRLGLAGAFPPALPASLLAVFGQRLRLDCRRAQSELGITFRGLGDLVAEAAAARAR